ncbi:hypothetical protein [Actinopolymorpha singaporensis]|uniref:Uncharacterized protein n=1 Tax=Actinopolymorpha singaporensis TaxID=117157 RepID=A0A1H1T9Y1_9ACTN|nr:hypothetical protein [Actinopolymorpha singaporensis]SDS57052.1 hypothetical protein SAMN04489717_3118 [Actinopolymorpha singaporensis]
MPQDDHAAYDWRGEPRTENTCLSEADQAVRAQAQRLIAQADRHLEELGYGPDRHDHHDHAGDAHVWPADGHRQAGDEPDEATGPDR